MRTIPILFDIDGIPGKLELGEPSVAKVRPFISLMGGDAQEFMLEMLNISLYCNGEPVVNALDQIGISSMTKLMPLVTELMGFGDDEGGD